MNRDRVDRGRRAAALWLGGSLAGCVDMTPLRQGGRVLSTTPGQRFTDEAVRRDWAALDALRGRIARARPGAPLAYAIARAEAQLDFAVDEYEENDRTGIVEPLLDDALRLVRTQEPGHEGPVDLALPVLPGTTTVRTDLWQLVAEAKADERVLRCAGEPIARLEAALLEYGHEQWEVDRGLDEPDHAEPYAALVDAMADELRRAAAACRAPTTTLLPPAGQGDRIGPPLEAVPPAAVPPLPPALPVALYPERLWVSTLFEFDQHEERHILPADRADLDRYARALLRFRHLWRRLVVTGHTDRLGGHGYNLRLSLRRAETIRRVLVLRYGLPAAAIEARGYAARQPVVHCTGPVDDALRACLQPNRRVAIEVLE